MSKKPRKPRTTTKQAATSQKSSRAVKAGDVESAQSPSAETREGVDDAAQDASHGAPDVSATALASPAEEATHAAESSGEQKTATKAAETATPSERAPGPMSSAPLSHAIQYQSLIPPTDDIDVGWGEEDDDAPESGGPVLAAPAVPTVGTQQEPSKGARSVEPEVAPVPEPTASSSDASAGVSAVTTQVAEKPPASAPPLAKPTLGASASKDSVSVRSSAPAEGAASGVRRPGRISAAPSFTAPPSSRPPAIGDSAAESARPSRVSGPSHAPGSLRAPGSSSASAENRPSRVPGAIRSSVAPRAATETPVAPTAPEPTLVAPVTPGSAPEAHARLADDGQQTAGAATYAEYAEPGRHSGPATVRLPGVNANAPAPVGLSSSTTATPTSIASEPALKTAISASHEPPQPAASAAQDQNQFAASAVPVESIPSSLPPSVRSRGPWLPLLWLVSVAVAAGIGWAAKPVPRPKPVNCDCTSKVQSAVREVMQQQQRSIESAPVAARAPSAITTAIPSEAASGVDSPAASTTASAPTPGSTVPVVVETKSDDRIDVLVKSHPAGVRVWRLGKAIGRTPLVIQIGRGERRIFEIGGPATGVRRLSLNGEKAEVTVDFTPPAKASK